MQNDGCDRTRKIKAMKMVIAAGVKGPSSHQAIKDRILRRGVTCASESRD